MIRDKISSLPKVVVVATDDREVRFFFFINLSKVADKLLHINVRHGISMASIYVNFLYNQIARLADCPM